MKALCVVHKKFNAKEQGICNYPIAFSLFLWYNILAWQKALKSEVAENLKQVEQGIPMELYPI